MITVAVVIVFGLTNCILTYGLYWSLRNRIQLIQDDASQIRMRTIVPVVNVGARQAPSSADLFAAAARMGPIQGLPGRNVPDPNGQVHPGPPS